MRPDRAHSNAAVTFIQLFNSALELSLHFHILIPDGVFIPQPNTPDARPRFVELPPPTNEDIATLLDEIIDRVTTMLKQHGRLDDDDLDDAPAPHLLLALAPTSRANPGAATEDPLPPLSRSRGKREKRRFIWYTRVPSGALVRRP